MVANSVLKLAADLLKVYIIFMNIFIDLIQHFKLRQFLKYYINLNIINYIKII